MIHLDRSPEPKCLSENGERWLKVFLDNKPSRPDPRQYGHREVRDALHAMSFNKCFYCEQKLGENEAEVEHFVEISTRPELAFTWTNLYLSCRGCNQAKRGRSPALSDCLDPCSSSHDPADHLTFSDEYIRPRAGSELGAKTIQKYRLDRDELTYKRVRALHRFEQFLRGLRERGLNLTDVDRERIDSFAARDHEFSLMFRVYLDGVNL